MKSINEIINESSRRDILRSKLTKFSKIIYQDGEDLVIGDETVAEIWDDGTIVFPKDFNPELAKFIVQCFIYGKSENETDESDYFISLGDPNKDGKQLEW